MFRLYGKLPSKSDHLAKHLKERKYFDSGDYALSKAGKASSVDTGSVGSQHPLPENIPHLASPGISNNSPAGGNNGSINLGVNGGLQSGSPVKESSYLNRETSADEIEKKSKVGEEDAKMGHISPPPAVGGIPIRK